MEQFNLSIPTRIYFGNDVLGAALIKEKELLAGNVMIVTGRQAMRKLGYLDKLQALLRGVGTVTNIVVSESISPNPKAAEVNAAAQCGLEHKVNVVIGLGGGSAVDAAKAIAVGIGSGEDIEPYMFNGAMPPSSTLPIIAMPTTAGTGSELSKGAIITSNERMVKTGIRGDNIYPRVAIVDPLLTLKVPKNISMETGFDVFAHAAESYISKQSNPFTEMLSLEAIKIVSKYLPRLLNDGDDFEAREKMSYASMLMGINLGNASTCLPHRLQYPVGAITDTSHGLGLASIYRAWFFFGYDYSRAKFNSIGSLLSGYPCESKADVLKSLDEFMERINLRATLSELGINESNLEIICHSVTGNLANDPASEAKGIVRSIYEASIFTNKYQY